jgi:aminopeptidase N
MRVCLAVLAALGLAGGMQGQATPPSQTPPPTATARAHPATARAHPATAKPPTKDDLLRGTYGPFRANNDLLFYALKLRVNPDTKTVAGTNLVRFKMLDDGSKIQLDLTPNLTVDSITFEGLPLHYTREERSLFLEFPRLLKRGENAEVTVAYSGRPVTQGRFGCFSFDHDQQGKPWIVTSCEDDGPSLWWPNKDQWRDEPQDGMEIDISVPNGLMDISNGRFVGSKDLGDGYTEWQWRVHYPINNYDVALNIGDYQHWSGEHTNKETGAKTTLDFYALPEDLDKAKAQFAQVPTMLDAFEHYFGEYPFDIDGYKLIQVPYSGMEHQTAIAYGNRFQNGYLGQDWTGVGISPRFDFIIVHESAHEWFGNAVTASDKSDMWIHEGWATYMESLYVEYRWGKADALKYLNGLKPKIHNEQLILAARGENQEPPEDQYFKAALMLNTLRSVIDDDAKWFADIHDFYQHFKYQTILTEDVVAWWNQRTAMDLTPFFNEYLRHASLPRLEFESVDPQHAKYRWVADEPGFAVPIRFNNGREVVTLAPVTGEWKTVAVYGYSSEAWEDVNRQYYIDFAFPFPMKGGHTPLPDTPTSPRTRQP